ncbi:uncharacterized protein ALTATR162_LOCUS4419 [Alternaria atra]|uniref:Uncharacterized protein n=1 Tax=Alternaria atra TaxID=119953 RepID=A0A8J2MZ47_9PLEO|nr:uncharacterized protein ALTATR162_LOCUS4419 [Alternaria atra]CAG5156622.1 unnamed protein product [Alternaria atra]
MNFPLRNPPDLASVDFSQPGYSAYDVDGTFSFSSSLQAQLPSDHSPSHRPTFRTCPVRRQRFLTASNTMQSLSAGLAANAKAQGADSARRLLGLSLLEVGQKIEEEYGFKANDSER